MALSIPGLAGPLEAAVHGDADQAERWMVMCHPHPQFGGSMENSVVYAVTRAGVASGYGVITFNVRGVGASAGGFKGGEGEADDVISVVDHIRVEYGCRPEQVVVAGYSFGAVVSAMSMARGLQPRAALWISPPIGMVPLPDEAVNWSGPKALVAGKNDDFCPAADAQAFCAAADPAIAYHAISGADHFYWGADADIESAATAFLKSLDSPGA